MSGAQPRGPKEATSRIRSFVERYLIERAGSFKPGEEMQQGWNAIKDAERLYKMVMRVEDPDAADDAAGAHTTRLRGNPSSPQGILRDLQAAVKDGLLSREDAAKLYQQMISPPMVINTAGVPTPVRRTAKQKLKGAI